MKPTEPMAEFMEAVKAIEDDTNWNDADEKEAALTAIRAAASKLATAREKEARIDEVRRRLDTGYYDSSDVARLEALEAGEGGK